MTDLREAAAHARRCAQAWSARPVEERVYLLTGWAATWINPLASSDRIDAVHEIAQGCGLSVPNVAWGITTTCDAALSGLETLLTASLGDLRRLGDYPTGAEGFPVRALPIALCGHVWASTLPTSGWIPALASLALGSAVLIKAPRPALAAAEHLAASLAEFDPLLGQAVAVSSWTGGSATDAELVELCDGIVVSGGRQAVDRYAALSLARRRGAIPCVAFGPGESLAVAPVDAGEPDLDTLDALALDVAAYDQLGCLSPTALWVEGAERVEPWAAGLASALDRVALELPRGEVPDDAAAAIMQRRGAAEFVGRVFEAADALVLLEPEPIGDTPRYRTVPVHTYDGGPTGLRDALMARPRRPRLLSAAVAGGLDTRQRYADALLPLGVHRICSPGIQQSPPATWHHDGMNWLAQLVRFVDLG